jgi:hypothetical protein
LIVVTYNVSIKLALKTAIDVQFRGRKRGENDGGTNDHGDTGARLPKLDVNVVIVVAIVPSEFECILQEADGENEQNLVPASHSNQIGHLVRALRLNDSDL